MRKMFAVFALLLVAGTPPGRQQGQTAHAGTGGSEEFASGAPMGQQPADLMAAAKTVGEVPVWENTYVRVHYAQLEYPVAERRIAEARPVVLYVRVAPEPGVVDTRLLDAPQGARPLWRPGVVPRGVRIVCWRGPGPVCSWRAGHRPAAGRDHRGPRTLPAWSWRRSGHGITVSARGASVRDVSSSRRA